MRAEPRRNLPQAGDRGAAASPLARPIGLGDPHLTRRPRPGTLPRIGRNPTSSQDSGDHDSDSASEPALQLAALGVPPVRTSLLEWCWHSLLETSQYSFDYGGQTDLYWADTGHPTLRSPSPLTVTHSGSAHTAAHGNIATKFHARRMPHTTGTCTTVEHPGHSPVVPSL